MRRIMTVALLRLGRRNRWRQLREMKAQQYLDRESLQKMHDRKLERILRYAAAHVPRYRELAAASGWRPESLSHTHLEAFPTVDKEILSADQPAYLSDVGAENRFSSSTGGSSGTRFLFQVDWRARDQRHACDLLGRTWTGWKLGEPQAVVWGHPGDMQAAETPKERLKNALLHRMITLNAWRMDEEVLQRFIERLLAHRPSFLYGYATALVFLAQTLRNKGITGVRPRGIISAAEYLGEDQRAIIEQQFACKVLNRYGSREFGAVAQQCERIGGFHVFTGLAHVELLRPDGTDCAPGERGEITVTDLNNRVMPFIRYRTGDLAVATDETCPCGRGYPLIASVEGRTTEMIVGREGRTFVCPTPSAWLKDMPGVRQLQIYQPDLENIEARVVPSPQWGEEAERRLTARFQELLGPIRVRIVLREEIPVSASGKYRFAISDVSPFNRPAAGQ